MADHKSSDNKKSTGTDASRRAFLKTALLGGAVVASTAGLSQVVKKFKPQVDIKQSYLDDDLQQEKVMKEKRYVLMTGEEKEEMVEKLVSDYKYTA